MIRSTTPEDVSAILALAVDAGLVPPDGTEELNQVLTSYFVGTLGRDHFWVTDEADDGIVGVAYYAPERLTEGTWNLYMIAIRPGQQGQGRGAALLRYVEQTLRDCGERMLLVETSSLPEFDRTRAFYQKCGYEEEARIREFWKAGDDKIIFRKLLTHS